MKTKFETIEILATMNGQLIHIGHKVSKGNISNEDVVKQLMDVEKILHQLIQALM